MFIKNIPFFYISFGVNRPVITPLKMEKTSSLTDEMPIYSFDFKPQEISNMQIDQSQMMEIFFENGNSIIIDDNTHFLTSNGWLRAKDLKVKDSIVNLLNYINPDLYGMEKLKIGYQNEINRNIIPVYIPDKNSLEFSEWLGIVSGHAEISKRNEISFVPHNENVYQQYKILTKNVVKITPTTSNDKRINRKESLIFFSKNSSQFAFNFLGQSFKLRKVPNFVIESSLSEQLAYIKGVGCHAYKDKNGNILFYQGTSKPIVDFVSIVLRHCGYQISVNTKNIKGVNYYYLKILGVFRKFYKIDFYDQSLHFIYEKKASSMVFINNEWRRFNTISDHFILDMIFYKTRITNIKKLGMKSSVKVKLQNTNGFLYNQIILSGHV